MRALRLIGLGLCWRSPWLVEQLAPGENVYLPSGGGAQRHLELRSVEMNLGASPFRNVVRPTKSTVCDVRVVVEIVF